MPLIQVPLYAGLCQSLQRRLLRSFLLHWPLPSSIQTTDSWYGIFERLAVN